MLSRVVRVILSLSLVAAGFYLPLQLPQAHAERPDLHTSPGILLDGIALGGSFWKSDCRCFVATPAALSTTRANDVIVVVAQCEVFSTACGDTLTSISDSEGHSWSLRAAYTPSHGRPVWEYYTIANSPVVSDRIDVTWSGSDPLGFAAFALNGANLHHPWEIGSPLELASGSNCVSSCGTVTIQTTAPQDFVIVSVASTGHCGNIDPFRTLAYVGGGGEVNYLKTSRGSRNAVSFTCDGYGEAVTILGDALRSQTAPSFGLDGVGVGTNTIPCCFGPRQSQLLTTTKAHDVIVLMLETGMNATLGIDDSNGLTFARRVSFSGRVGSNTLWEYFAVADSPLERDNITVNAPNNSIIGMQVFGIMGANPKAIFDPNPSIPALASCPFLSGVYACAAPGYGACLANGFGTCSASIRTFTIDFVVTVTAINDAPPCGPYYRIGVVPGFESLVPNPNSNFEIDFTITSVPRTTVVFSCNGTDATAFMMDAISYHGTA